MTDLLVVVFSAIEMDLKRMGRSKIEGPLRFDAPDTAAAGPMNVS